MSIMSTGAGDGEILPILSAKWDGHSTFSMKEVAEILGISVWTAYDEAKHGRLPIIKIGTRKIVPRRALERMLTSV